MLTRTLRMEALPWAGTALMILSAAAWGSGTVMSKFSLEAVPPVTLLVAQLAASSALLWLLTAAFGLLGRVTRKTARHGWTGILEPGLAYLTGLIGLQMTSATNASLLGATEPFVVLLLAWLFLRERIQRRMVALLALALVGTVLVSGLQESGAAARASVEGDALYLSGVGFAALYVIFSRRSVAHLDPLPLAALQQSFGLLLALAALPFGLMSGEGAALAHIPVSAWLWAALTGIVQYALAFLFYLMALKTLPAVQAAFYLTLIPLFGVAGSALFLGENLGMAQLGGGALILLALVGLRWRSGAAFRKDRRG